MKKGFNAKANSNVNPCPEEKTAIATLLQGLYIDPAEKRLNELEEVKNNLKNHHPSRLKTFIKNTGESIRDLVEVCLNPDELYELYKLYSSEEPDDDPAIQNRCDNIIKKRRNGIINM